MTLLVRVALRSAQVTLQEAAVSLTPFLYALVQPFFIGVTAMYMLRNRPDFEAIYVVIGTGLTGIWTMVLFTGAQAISQERGRGTLELVATSPVPLAVICGGQMLAQLAMSLSSMLLSYLIGAWLFGYSLAVHNPAGLVLTIPLALLSLWTMGMLFAPLAILSPALQQILSGLEYPIYILCRFLFPVLLLPGWILPVSFILPPYWAARALHGTTSGDLPVGELVQVWLLLAATSVGIIALALWLFHVFLTRARRNGTLAHV